MLTIPERFNGSSHLPKPLCENTGSLNSVTHALASVSYCFHSIRASKSSSKPIKFSLSTEVSAAACSGFVCHYSLSDEEVQEHTT